MFNLPNICLLIIAVFVSSGPLAQEPLEFDSPSALNAGESLTAFMNGACETLKSVERGAEDTWHVRINNESPVRVTAPNIDAAVFMVACNSFTGPVKDGATAFESVTFVGPLASVGKAVAKNALISFGPVFAKTAVSYLLEQLKATNCESQRNANDALASDLCGNDLERAKSILVSLESECNSKSISATACTYIGHARSDIYDKDKRRNIVLGLSSRDTE